MKFLAMIMLLSAPLAVHAISIEKISGNLSYFTFANDQGEGLATDMHVELDDGRKSRDNKAGKSRTSAQKIYVYRNGNDLNVKIGFLTVDWEDVPVWLTANLDLDAKDVKLQLGNPSGQVVSAKRVMLSKPSIGRAAVRGVELKCVPAAGESSRFDNLLGQCLNDGVVNAKYLDVPSLRSFWLSILEDQNDRGEDLTKIGKDLEVVLNQNKFFMGLKTRVFFGARIRAWGKAVLDEKAKILRVRLDKVKFGRLSVTPLVWPALRMFFKSEDVEVRKPYLNIKL